LSKGLARAVDCPAGTRDPCGRSALWVWGLSRADTPLSIAVNQLKGCRTQKAAWGLPVTDEDAEKSVILDAGLSAADQPAELPIKNCEPQHVRCN
jgi:hypothetical protein